MNKEQKLVPKMRFTEFENSNNWKQNKLGDMVNYVVDNRGKNPSYYCNDGIPIIDNFMIKNKAYPNLNEAVRYIDEYLYNNFIRKHNELNDVLITLVGNGIGNITLFPNEKSAIIQNTLGLRFNDNKKFMFYLMLAIHNEILLLNRGMAQPNIRQDELLDINIKLPDIKEQQKIGDFFTRLDEMIQLQQSKVNKVKDIKSAYLSEMFPKEGEKYPKKRFEGFTKEWKFQNLEALTTTFTDGDWIESKDQSDSGVRLIQTGNIGVTQFLDKPKNKKWISKSAFTKLNCKEIFPGDILISRLPEPAGRATIIPELNTRMITAVDCTIVRPSSEYSSDFLIQYLSTSNYFNKITAELAGGTRQRISRSNLAEIKVPVPKTLEEQEKIGYFFKNLDNQISIEEEKLAKLEKLKQAYLNDMFV